MTGISRRLASLALAAGMTLALSACGQSTQSKACDQVDRVRSSIEDLRNVNLAENGVVAMQDALAQVKTDLEQLRSELGSAAQTQFAGVQSSFGQLSSSVATAVSDPTQANLDAVGAARNAARSSVQGLATSVTSGC